MTDLNRPSNTPTFSPAGLDIVPPTPALLHRLRCSLRACRVVLKGLSKSSLRTYRVDLKGISSRPQGHIKSFLSAYKVIFKGISSRP